MKRCNIIVVATLMLAACSRPVDNATTETTMTAVNDTRSLSTTETSSTAIGRTDTSATSAPAPASPPSPLVPAAQPQPSTGTAVVPATST